MTNVGSDDSEAVPLVSSSGDLVDCAGELERYHDLATALDAITDYAIVRFDLNGRITGWSRGGQAVTGYTAEEVIGQPVTMFFTGEDKEARLFEQGFDAASTGRFEFEGPRVRKDGEIFWCQGVLSSVRDPTGNLTGFVSVYRDITERRRIEEMMARLAAVVRSSDDAMFSMNEDGCIVTWNAGAERLLGYSEGEMVARPVEALIPDEVRGDFDAVIKRLGEGERVERYDSFHRRKDGSLVEVEVSLSAIKDSTGTLIGYAAVLRDLTERRRAEAERETGRAREEIFAERDRIARDLHDLVIQRLFAAGLALEGTRNLIRDPESAGRLERIVEDLDTTIREIRTTIFALGHDRERDASSVRARLLEVAADAVVSLGFEPRVRVVGAVDTLVSPEVADHLVATAREALSNVARHAKASSVELTLVAGEEIVLEVVDDGRGLGDVSRRSGLANLADRARTLGGRLVMSGNNGGGTRLRWSVPPRSSGLEPETPSRS